MDIKQFKNILKGHPVKRIWVNIFEKHGSFFGVTSEYQSADSSLEYAGSTSSSYVDAAFKAVIEGYEHWRSGILRVDFFGSAKNLNNNWIHPKLISPLSKEQTEKCGVSYFTEDLEIPWTDGTDIKGNTVYVPSDIVYYGYETNQNRVCFSHSSGIAAHFNLKDAQIRSLIELIERDALMRNWFLHTSPNRIENSCLPCHARKRIKHWKEYNRSLIILEMPSD